MLTLLLTALIIGLLAKADYPSEKSGVLSWFALPVGETTRYSIHIPTK
jgi:hypothetical protein